MARNRSLDTNNILRSELKIAYAAHAAENPWCVGTIFSRNMLGDQPTVRAHKGVVPQ